MSFAFAGQRTITRAVGPAAAPNPPRPPRPPPNPPPAAPAAETAEAARAAAAGHVQYRILAEVHRQILAVEPVGDRTLEVRHHAAHNRPAREEALRMLHRHAARKVVLRQQTRRRAFRN